MIDTRLTIALLCLCFVSGCGGGTSVTPVVVPPPPSLDDLPLVAHPEYDNWSRFPEGTKVIRKDDLASTDKSVVLHTTLVLAKKSDKGVTIESQTAIEREGVREESDPTETEYPAQFRLPKGFTIEQFQLPTLKAKKTGDETLVVAGKEYATEVYTFQDQSEAGPVDVKLWRSSDIPGRQVKKEIVDRKGVVLSSSNVVEVATP